MEPRRIGEDVTKVTRQDANIKVQRQQRYKQIIECLREHNLLTAKECAVIMQRKGYIPTTERNYTAPRLTELSEIGVVEPVGKKRCDYTGKLVAVYALREVPERNERKH